MSASYTKTIYHSGGVIRKRGPASYQAEVTEHNKRRRKTFRTIVEGKDWIDSKRTEIRREGKTALVIPEGSREDAVKAVELADGQVTLSDAVSFWLKHNVPKGGIREVQDYYEEYYVHMRDKAEASREYLKDIKSHAGWMSDCLKGTNLQDISTEQLRKLLEEEKGHVAQTTRKSIVNTWITFFNAAIAAGHLGHNPATDILPPNRDRKRAKKINQRKPPEILPVRHVQKFFKVAEILKPDYVCGFALNFFAGLRTEEISRMRWEYIDVESAELDLKGIVTKTGEHRFVAMQPNLVEWIKAYGKEGGPLFLGDTTYAMLRRYERARIAVCERAKIKWVHNAGRHSFASYHFRHFGNEIATFTEMGHDNVAVFRAHYKNIVRKKDDAALYWKIVPLLKDD